MPDFDFVVDALVALHQQIIERDPLLARGIGLTWLCVINPAMVRPIQQRYAESPRLWGVGSLDTLSAATGRPTWILNAAPVDRIEYMPVAEAIRRYGDTMQPSDLETLKEISHSYALDSFMKLRPTGE